MTAVIVKRAVLSDDPARAFRYRLERWWDEHLPPMVWVMLNPSTADAEVDDPTIQACMQFARLNGYGGIVVVNLFAFRSPHPKVMQAAVDPVGPFNDLHLSEVFEEASEYGGAVVAAWGTGGSYRGRDRQVIDLIESHGNTLLCFGRTKDGHPKHPLARGHHRIPRTAAPMPFRAAA
jgi:hypothetical protein